jgi:hypothetical protein
MKIKLTENEKNEISSMYEEIDNKLFNFLLRRLKKEEDFYNSESFTVYYFEDFPDDKFNSLMKKYRIETFLIDFLIKIGKMRPDYFVMKNTENDGETKKVLNTIRKFINFL